MKHCTVAESASASPGRPRCGSGTAGVRTQSWPQWLQQCCSRAPAEEVWLPLLQRYCSSPSWAVQAPAAAAEVWPLVLCSRMAAGRQPGRFGSCPCLVTDCSRGSTIQAGCLCCLQQCSLVQEDSAAAAGSSALSPTWPLSLAPAAYLVVVLVPTPLLYTACRARHADGPPSVYPPGGHCALSL